MSDRYAAPGEKNSGNPGLEPDGVDVQGETQCCGLAADCERRVDGGLAAPFERQGGVGGDGEPAQVDARAAGVHEHGEGPRQVIPGRR